MASVTVPLFSLNASGTFGKFICYHTSKSGKNTCRLNPPIFPDRTTSQNFFAKVFGMVIEDWRTCSPSLKSLFHSLALSKPLSSLNVFFSIWFDYIIRPRAKNSRTGTSRPGAI